MATYPTEAPGGTRADVQSSSIVGPDGTIYISDFSIGNLFALRDPGSGDRLEVRWRFHPPGGRSLHATPALGADGNVYLGFTTGQGAEAKGTLYSVRAPGSGSEAQAAWSVDLGAGG
jgi:outer membrane protein assembly factor BamB